MPEPSASCRGLRYQVVLPIHYQPAGLPGARPGWTCDVSTGGACLELAESLAVGTSLSLEVQTGRDRLPLEAGVVWVDPRRPSRGWSRHGVAFTGIPPARQPSLRALLSQYGRVWRPARMPVRLPARCLPSGAPATPPPRPFIGWTADLGPQGLSIDLSRRFPAGALLELTVAAPQGRIAIRGTVAWVEPPDAVPAGTGARHGLRCVDPCGVREFFLSLLQGRWNSLPSSAGTML